MNTLPAIVLKIELGNLLRVETLPPVIGRRNRFVELYVMTVKFLSWQSTNHLSRPFDTVKCILSIGTEDNYTGHTFITKVDLDDVTREPMSKHRK